MENFLRRPDPEVLGVLLFGPDQGLVRERADILARSVVGDLDDPFRVVELTGAAVISDPPRLADEALSLSMTGGRRVVRIHGATDGIAEICGDFLKDAKGENLVIAEAQNLAPRSSLRKLFERAGNAAVIGCYEDSGRDLKAIIGETLGRHGLAATPDAMAFLVDNLGGDRLVTRSELEKLALYVDGHGGGGAREKEGVFRDVSLDDAMACVGDSAAMSLDAVVYAAAGGRSLDLDRALDRAFLEGITPVAVLRALQRHLQKLHLVLGIVEKGEAADKAIEALRPRVIYKFKAPFRAQVGCWQKDRRANALELVTETEIDCKSTGYPAESGCHRALARIAQAARAGTRAGTRAGMRA